MYSFLGMLAHHLNRELQDSELEEVHGGLAKSGGTQATSRTTKRSTSGSSRMMTGGYGSSKTSTRSTRRSGGRCGPGG